MILHKLQTRRLRTSAANCRETGSDPEPEGKRHCWTERETDTLIWNSNTTSSFLLLIAHFCSLWLSSLGFYRWPDLLNFWVLLVPLSIAVLVSLSWNQNTDEWIRHDLMSLWLMCWLITCFLTQHHQSWQSGFEMGGTRKTTTPDVLTNLQKKLISDRNHKKNVIY